MQTFQMGLTVVQSSRWRGNSYFGGDPPAGPGPDEADGRAKILNVPSRVRICVYERGSMLCVADRLSDAAGSWRVEHLDGAIHYVIIGYDNRGLVNAAIQDWVVPAAME